MRKCVYLLMQMAQLKLPQRHATGTSYIGTSSRAVSKFIEIQSVEGKTLKEDINKVSQHIEKKARGLKL